MSREYVIILIFLIFSFAVGFVNRPNSVLSFFWAVFYLLYLILSVMTTFLITVKSVIHLREYEMIEIEKIASNLLVMGILTVAPYLAKEAGYQLTRLRK